MRFISFDELKGRGISFSRSWICRLIKQGKFPRPVKLGYLRVGWVEAEVDQWMRDRIKQRDSSTSQEQ